MRRGVIAVFLVILAAGMPSTAAHASGLTAQAISYQQMQGWPQDNHAEALRAFLRSCTKILPKTTPAIGEGIFAAPASAWKQVCEQASAIAPQQARAFFEREFIPHALFYGGNPNGKFTGYYEPLMRGAWERKAGYDTAVYARPADLPRDGSVYRHSRRDVENGALAGQGLELMYISNPVDVFFLHVQGSGRVLMDTGELVALRFDGKNNQPYTAIGKVLISRGELTRENVSAPSIRAWLNAHPQQAREVMQQNDSFVFFKVEHDVSEGPVGAQNVPLIAERALAVDASFIPLGMPLWLDTTLPHSAFGKGEAYQRLMVAQDKGSAITGAIRGDVFFGFGERAEDLAGHMHQDGRFVALVPRAVVSHTDTSSPQATGAR